MVLCCWANECYFALANYKNKHGGIIIKTKYPILLLLSYDVHH